MSTHSKTGVLLMSYGSATTAEGVADFLQRIHQGAAPPSLIHDFEERYRLIGRSPLIEVTTAQAAALQGLLGEGYVVRAGMRHSPPFIVEAAAALRGVGADSLVGVILSPQSAPFITRGYEAAFAEAAHAAGFSQARVSLAEAWPTEPHFIELLTKRVVEKLALLERAHGRRVPVIFTTHSLPRSVVAGDPGYLVQLGATVGALREQLDPALEWYAGYQSAGHRREAWLTPDLADILTQLGAQGAPAVLIVPIQFVADHLETLYDLDHAARVECEACGMSYHRIKLPNTDPLFIEALAAVVRGTTRRLLVPERGMLPV
jgi:ferrochelatase